MNEGRVSGRRKQCRCYAVRSTCDTLRALTLCFAMDANGLFPARTRADLEELCLVAGQTRQKLVLSHGCVQQAAEDLLRRGQSLLHVMSQVDAEVRKLPVSKLAQVVLHSQLEVSKAEKAAEEQRRSREAELAALQRFAEESEAVARQLEVEAALAKGRQLPTPATVAASARRMGEDDEVQSYEWLRMCREDDCRQAGLGLCFVDDFEARRRLARLLTARASRRTPYQDVPSSIVECLDILSQAGSYRLLFEEFREIVELIEELHVSSQCRSRHALNAGRMQPRQWALPGTESRKLRPFEAALFDRCDGVQLACFLESLKAVLEQGQEIHARLARLDTLQGSTSAPQHFNLAEDQPKPWAKAPPPPFVEPEPARKPVLKAAPPGLAPSTTTVQVKARPTSKAPPSKGKAPPPGFRSDEAGAAETHGQARAAEPAAQGKAPPPHLRMEAPSSGTEGSPTHRPALAQGKAPPAHLDPLAKALPPKPQERQPSSPDRGGGTSLPSAPPQAFSKAPPPPLEDTSPEESHPVAKESPAAPAVKQPTVKAPPPLFEEKADEPAPKPATKAPPPAFVEDLSTAPRSPPVKQPGAKAPPPHLADQGPPAAESSVQRSAPKVTFSDETEAKELSHRLTLGLGVMISCFDQLSSSEPPYRTSSIVERPPARPASPPVKQPATKAPPPVFVEDRVPDADSSAAQPPAKDEVPADAARSAPPPFLVEDRVPDANSSAAQPPAKDEAPADAARSVEEERPPARPASPLVKQPATKAPPPFLVEAPEADSEAKQPPAKDEVPAEAAPAVEEKKPAAKAPPPFLVETPAEQSTPKEEEQRSEPILTAEDSVSAEPCRTLHPPEVDGPPVIAPPAPSAKAPPTFMAADEHGSGDAKAPVPEAYALVRFDGAAAGGQWRGGCTGGRLAMLRRRKRVADGQGDFLGPCGQSAAAVPQRSDRGWFADLIGVAPGENQLELLPELSLSPGQATIPGAEFVQGSCCSTMSMAPT
eukprot:s307_g9.t2